jgi:hypothetical protein
MTLLVHFYAVSNDATTYPIVRVLQQLYRLKVVVMLTIQILQNNYYIPFASNFKSVPVSPVNCTHLRPIEFAPNFSDQS